MHLPKPHQKNKSTVGTLVDKDGKLCNTAAEKSECLRKQFESVFTKPDINFMIDNIDVFCIETDRWQAPTGEPGAAAHLSSSQSYTAPVYRGSVSGRSNPNLSSDTILIKSPGSQVSSSFQPTTVLPSKTICIA